MLNDQPRITLGFLTPQEVFGKLLHLQLRPKVSLFSNRLQLKNKNVKYIEDNKRKNKKAGGLISYEN
jgi:hypothetical protein